MDSVFYDKILCRILQGRLRLTLGDLVLYVYEPDLNLSEEALDVYDEAYKKAYFRGCYIKKELLEILVNNDLWSPFDDREADKIDKQIDELKIEAFKSFYDTKKLRGIKASIRALERAAQIYRGKKTALDHTSCEGVAAFSRAVWLISQTTKLKDGSNYAWDKYPISIIMDHYASNSIKSEVFRVIARTEPWRSMWCNGKAQSNVFGKPTCQLTKDQLALCSFAFMYDNVYENPERPNEKVIADDDCLAGWLIALRRKQDKDKNYIAL